MANSKLFKVNICILTGFAVLMAAFMYERYFNSKAASLFSPLPEFREFPEDREPREVLIDEAKSRLDHILNSTYARGNGCEGSYDFRKASHTVMNFEVAKAILDYPSDASKLPPLVLGSFLCPTLTPYQSRSVHTFIVVFLDLNREADNVILFGKMPNGRLVKVIYQINPEFKNMSMVYQFGGRDYSLVSSSKFLEGKAISHKENFDVVQVCFTETMIPDLEDLVVGVTDRNGLSSNFVSVDQEKLQGESEAVSGLLSGDR